MKRILLTTTSLVLAAGVAQADVTFSGKAEAGVSRTSKVDAVTAVNAAVEFDTTTTASTTLSTAAWVGGALKLTAAAGTAATSASNIATDVNNIITALENAKQAVLVSQNAMNEDTTAVAAAVEKEECCACIEKRGFNSCAAPAFTTVATDGDASWTGYWCCWW